MMSGPLEIYWTLALEENSARAELWTHPLGYELRILSDHVFRWGHVYRQRDGADHDADVARRRLEEKGWYAASSAKGPARKQ
ncbi:MAG: hypothetical protein ACRD2X_11220 [Vicinamibacteraceae bacterium]